MDTNVLNFFPNGTLQHTLKDSYFNTSVLGKRKVERMTEISFQEILQKFYICVLNEELFKANNSHIYLMEEGADDKVLYFNTYEEAVEKEIEWVNSLRLQGLEL